MFKTIRTDPKIFENTLALPSEQKLLPVTSFMNISGKETASNLQNKAHLCFTK